MSIDRDTTRIVRSWLRTEMRASPDRVLGAVIDGLDTTPQRREISARRSNSVFYIIRFGAVAAVASMAILIGYALIAGPARVGPQPVPSATVATPRPLPDAFDSRTITLDSGLAETSLEVDLPADGSLVTGSPDDFAWRFTASDGGPAAYLGSWGLVVADVTDATNHRDRRVQDPIPAGDSAAFLASLAALDGYEISAQGEIEIAGRLGVVANVTVATSEEPAPIGDSEGYPHLDVNGEGGILFGEATRLYVVEIGGRLILIQVWSTSDAGLEAHRQLEDRIIGSIHEAAGDSP